MIINLHTIVWILHKVDKRLLGVLKHNVHVTELLNCEQGPAELLKGIFHKINQRSGGIW